MIAFTIGGAASAFGTVGLSMGEAGQPVSLVAFFTPVGKIDKIKKPDLLPLIDQYSKLAPFDEIVPISALKGDNIETLGLIGVTSTNTVWAGNYGGVYRSSDSGENWEKHGLYQRTEMLSRLRERFSCITFDKRESGDSGGPDVLPGPATYPHWASDSVEVTGLPTKVEKGAK